MRMILGNYDEYQVYNGIIIWSFVLYLRYSQGKTF
jgi:hypothetical protein